MSYRAGVLAKASTPVFVCVCEEDDLGETLHSAEKASFSVRLYVVLHLLEPECI